MALSRKQRAKLRLLLRKKLKERQALLGEQNRAYRHLRTEIYYNRLSDEAYDILILQKRELELVQLLIHSSEVVRNCAHKRMNVLKCIEEIKQVREVISGRVAEPGLLRQS